ncbi:MAG: DNA replication/repair protein RecF [Clostridiales bacterium]|nr:DNA replication/repair protein RecF [Clostridiales bacterium]
MRVAHIELTDFRCYRAAALAPHPGVTALVGDNAQGKTNLLEAVVLCCAGRSHRTSRDRELVRWGAAAARAQVSAERYDGSHQVDMRILAEGGKAVRVNGSAIGRSGELMGHINGVLFSPEDLRMVKDGPAERRRFVDMELSQIRPSYYYALQRYNRALKQRGCLLREIAHKPGLRATLGDWDAQLAQSGAAIIEHRRAFLDRLSSAASETHAAIAGGERLKVDYLPSVASDAAGAALVDALFRALRAAEKQDLMRLTTSVGPHRDDLRLSVGGSDVRAYGSQGQQRTAALSMKLSELKVMREETGEWPVLMLDDVMSELDPGRRRQLLRMLGGVQAIVTCTDLSDLAGADIGACYRVSAGELTGM